jgi:hypothetical protein
MQKRKSSAFHGGWTLNMHLLKKRLACYWTVQRNMQDLHNICLLWSIITRGSLARLGTNDGGRSEGDIREACQLELSYLLEAIS